MNFTDSEHAPTHFDILSISADNLGKHDPTEQCDMVKKAYRRALLKHHPDKQAQSTAEGTEDSCASQAQHFTVDQITTAYNVLIDEQQRRKYTRELREQRTFRSSGSSSTKSRGNRKSKTSGMETVDLDDMSWSGKRRLYYHACQGCGKTKGFTLREDDIEDDEEEFELNIECSGCNRELKVIVPALVNEASVGEGEGEVSGVAAEQSRSQDQAVHQSSTSNTEPQKKGWGWGIRLGLGLGLSLGGGGTASAGRSG